MVPWRATDSGDVTPELLAWYGRFAEGRPGAIVVEATGIRDVPSGPLLRIGHDRFIPGLRELADTVRAKSGGETKLFIQIIDFLTIRRRPEREKYFRRFLRITSEHRAALGMLDEPEDRVREALMTREELLTAREREDLEHGYRERVTDLHLPHVRELPRVLPELFASAARRAELAGFDGVELHFAHAYTMASFLSRRNDRDDGYGGTRENRVRLPLEVYRAARAAMGSSTILGCRFLGDEVIEGGSRIEDACWYAVRFAEAGMDYLSLSKGGKFEDARQPRVGEAAYPYTGESGHECMPTIHSDERGPLGRNLHLARDVRSAVRSAGFTVPIVASGALNTFDIAERALLEGDADIIAAARQSLADPDWWMKMRLGRGGEIRCCSLTNYCEGLDQRHKQVTCRLWDRQLDEDALLASDGKRRLVAPPWRTHPPRP
jgi:2,4-dienoyl-CoA reductase-like NADH-dependent reductase (Old Yellow Enzyme family)